MFAGDKKAKQKAKKIAGHLSNEKKLFYLMLVVLMR